MDGQERPIVHFCAQPKPLLSLKHGENTRRTPQKVLKSSREVYECSLYAEADVTAVKQAAEKQNTATREKLKKAVEKGKAIEVERKALVAAVEGFKQSAGAEGAESVERETALATGRDQPSTALLFFSHYFLQQRSSNPKALT